jgi:hypothetical protein
MLPDIPFIKYYLFCLAVIVPLGFIFKRAGVKTAWVALLTLPEIGFLLCVAYLAFAKWPPKKGA